MALWTVPALPADGDRLGAAESTAERLGINDRRPSRKHLPAAPNLTPLALDKPVLHEAPAQHKLPAISLTEPTAPACPQRLGRRFALPTLTHRAGGGGEHFFVSSFLPR